MGSCAGKRAEEVTDDGNKDNELRRVFEQFDLDGDGFIDESELKNVMEKMGQNPTGEDIRLMFKAADTNQDGRISFEEFTVIAQQVVR